MLILFLNSRPQFPDGSEVSEKWFRERPLSWINCMFSAVVIFKFSKKKAKVHVFCSLANDGTCSDLNLFGIH